MVIFLAAIGVGLVIGLVRGGRIRHLARIRPRWPALGGAGLVGVLVASFAPLAAPEIVLTAALAACLVFCLFNLRLRGLGVVAVGLAANLAPLVVNGFVPVDSDALVHAEIADRGEVETIELDGAQRVADDETPLWFLGRIIPVPELGLVLSFGDLIVAAGLGAAARNSVRHRRVHGVPAARVLAADDRATAGGDDDELIDLTRFGSGRRRQHPVEVAPGEPVPIPMGWGPDPDEDDLVGAGVGGRTPGDGGSTPHVPWPWRRTPPPRATHPTMRVRQRT